MKTVVTKGEFARLKRRSPAAVTKWIKLGKISPSALIGQGNSAKIWIEQADADLAASLDPAQQLIQPSPVAPTVTSAMTSTVAEQLGVPHQSPPLTLTAQREADLARRAKADADRAEQDAIAAIRKNAAEDGKWVLADDAAREFAEELRRYVSETETFLAVTAARELADEHGLDFKAVSVKLRNLYRKHRLNVAKSAEADLAEPITDDDIGRSAPAGAVSGGESRQPAAAG